MGGHDNGADGLSEFHAILQSVIAEPLEQSHKQVRDLIKGAVQDEIENLRASVDRSRNESLRWRQRADLSAERRDAAVAELDSRVRALITTVEVMAETITQTIDEQRQRQVEEILTANQATWQWARRRTRALTAVLLAQTVLLGLAVGGATIYLIVH